MQKKWFSVYINTIIPEKPGNIKYCIIKSVEILQEGTTVLIDEEYDASGKFSGVEVPFKIIAEYHSDDILKSYPTSLLVTLFRKEGSNDFVEITHGIYNFNKIDNTENEAIIDGSLIDKFPIIGVNYTYKIVVTSNTEVLLKDGTNATAIKIESNQGSYTPGYLDNFYSYPLFLEIDTKSNINIAKISWDYPGAGLTATTDPINNYNSSTSSTSNDYESPYKDLLENGFSEPPGLTGYLSNELIPLSARRAKVSVEGLFPRFFDDTCGKFFSFNDIIKKEAKYKNQANQEISADAAYESFHDVEDWFFEIQVSKKVPDDFTANKIKDIDPDDNSSDYSPVSNDEDFELIYRGKDTKFEYILPSGTINYVFSGTLMVKWSTRILRLLKNNGGRKFYGDPRLTGISISDSIPIEKKPIVD
jgi:hypothetical protein